MEGGVADGNDYAIRWMDKNRVELEYPYHWNAFLTLLSERQMGMSSYGPIPESKIAEYADYDRLNKHERNVLLQVIRILDNHLRRVESEKLEKAAK